MQRHAQDMLSDKCIWMDAGVLTYRLCDRAHDCERCPLDAVLRKREQPFSSGMTPEDTRTVTCELPASCPPEAARLLESYRRADIRSSLRYGACGTWVRLFDRRLAVIGIDDQLSACIPEESVIVFPALDAEISSGQPLCWIYIGDNALPIASPLSGTPQRLNPHLGPDSLLVHTSPYDLGWLMTMVPSHIELEHPRLMAAAEAESAITARIELFLQRAARGVSDTASPTGACLNDGGVPVDSLPDALGARAYTDLLRSVFTPRQRRAARG